MGVQSPQPAVAQTRRSQQVGVHPGDARSKQPVLFQEAEYLIVVRGCGGRQALKIAQNLRPGAEIAAREFADHEGVHQDSSVRKRLA